MRWIFVRRWVLAAVLCLVSAPAARPQGGAGVGGLSGLVKDTSGRTVPEARVVVANESRGIRRTLLTNLAGYFSAPALVPASDYSVAVTKDGFASYEAVNLEILVGQNVVLEIVLTVAASKERIEVTASPIVEESRNGVSQVVEASQIQDLPTNGRRVHSFVLLTPAVAPDGTSGLVSFRGIAGGNSYLTDGNDTTNRFYNENAGRTRIASPVAQDAVQEFQVVPAGRPVEYGRALGGVVNTVTRSGSNQAHGTGYWFYRNQDFNATDPHSRINPPEVRHQAGASLGGPVIKDRLFYFGNGEVLRRDFPIASSLTRPPLFDPNGRFEGYCQTGPGRATIAQCEQALEIFDPHFGIINRTASQELAFGKLDWRPSERHSVSAAFNYLRWLSPHGILSDAVRNDGAAIGGNGDSTVRTRYAGLSWIGVLDQARVNEFRFGWFKDRLFDDFSSDLVPAATGLASLTVQGQANLGAPDYLPRLIPSEDRFQFADIFTRVAGRHTLKLGLEYAGSRDTNISARRQFGAYSYSSFTAFAMDLSGNTKAAKNWTTYSQRFGDPRVDFRTHDLSGFVQDQFRVTPRLTWNWGVRYEYSKAPRPAISNPDYPQTGRIPADRYDFAPRFGIAYALNEGRTALRAGYGIFYSRHPGALTNTLLLENGVYQKEISLSASRPEDLEAGPVFPARLDSTGRTPASGTVSLTFAADSLRNGYAQELDAGIEHALTPNLALTVSYVWSRGLHLTAVRDANMGPLGNPVTFKIVDESGVQTGSYATPTYRRANRVDPRYQRLNVVESGAQSYYNAMVVQVRKRLSMGLQASAAYTWSHAIDFGQPDGTNNLFFNDGPRSLWNGDYRGEKASSILDQRHRLVIASVYAPRVSTGSGWISRYLINNWQFSQVTTLASGPPVSATVLVTGYPFADAPYTGSLNGLGGANRVPFWPARSLDLDRVFRIDARLTKTLPLAERFRVNLNFEVYNALNRTSDTKLNTAAYQLQGGMLWPVPRFGEGVASEGYPDGTNARRAQVSMRFLF